MRKDFKEIKIVDKFYQSSSFFPMPLTLIGTLDEKGKGTSFGSYSLIFPYYIAGKKYYAMLLECRNSSNTCKGLLRHGKCTINFMPYSKKIFKKCVEYGFPGDTAIEKEKKHLFKTRDSFSQKEDPKNKYPQIIEDAYQVFECTWVKELDHASKDPILEDYAKFKYHNFNGITSEFGAHFILKVDKIILQEKYANAIINGVKKSNFCPLPTNWGYRDSANFWCGPHKKPSRVGIANREVDMESLQYAAHRLRTDVKFDDEALKMLGKVPRIFLKFALQGCVDWAEEHNVKLITKEVMEQINKDRKNKKGRK